MKSWLKLNIQRTKIMASCLIVSWKIYGEKWKQQQIFFPWAPKSQDGDLSHEIKKCLLLARKAMTNLDSILKSKDITVPTKVYIVKAIAFPVVMYRYGSWTMKKAEFQRCDAFELWC